MKQTILTSNRNIRKSEIRSITALLFIVIVIAFLFSLSLNADDNAGKRASLWRENSSFTKLYSDPKACGINDIVTINISESSTASNKAGLTTSKKSSTSMGIGNLMGLETDLAGTVTKSFDPKSMFGATTNNSNAGSGETTRESTLTSYITARVIDVLPNGNLVIEAKKEVMVNKEKQIAVLSGIIRPRDIAYNNVIASNKIADMQIKFSGKGPVSEQTHRGWLSWLLNTIWPF